MPEAIMYKIMSAQCSHHRVIKFHNCCIQASTISASGHHWNPSLPFPGWLVRNITPLARRKQQESPPLSYHTIPYRPVPTNPRFSSPKKSLSQRPLPDRTKEKKKKKRTPFKAISFASGLQHRITPQHHPFYSFRAIFSIWMTSLNPSPSFLAR